MQNDHRVRLRSRPELPATAPGRSSSAQIRLVFMRLAELRPSSRRSRRHNRGNRELIKASLERHGDLGAIVATEDGEVLDGNERLEAYRELGRDHVPVLVVSNRSPAARTAARLILNRAHEVGGTWDMPSLAQDFRELLSVDPTLIAVAGFTMAEVDGAV